MIQVKNWRLVFVCLLTLCVDGKDLGADVDGVEAATANSPTGNWPSP